MLGRVIAMLIVMAAVSAGTPPNAFGSFPGRNGRIAYSDGDIKVIDASGSNERSVTTGGEMNDRYPTWSPDGRWIAFARIAGQGGYELFKVRPDGTGLAPVAS